MTAPKKPTDYLVSFDEVEGSELIIPLKQIKGSDQLRLVAQAQKVGIFSEENQDEVSPDDLDYEALADLTDYVEEHFARDPKAFAEFTSGKGGLERTIQLVMGLFAALGE